MRVRGPVVVLAAFGLSAAWLVGTGCSTFDSEPAVADAATGPADALSDGGGPPIDSAAPLDASPDVTPAFCATSDAAFCADFEVPPLQTGFNPGQFRDHGLLDLTSVGHPSSPLHALRGTAFALPDGGDAGGAEVYGAILTKDMLRLGARGFRIELDVRIDALPPATSFVSIGGLDAKLGGAQNSVAIAFAEPSGYVLVERRAPTASKDTYPFALPAKKTWTHLRLDVDLGASTITFYVDGSAALAVQSGITADSLAVTLNVGNIVLPPAAEVSVVALDNVVVNRF